MKIGAMFIFMTFKCKYGAELFNERTNAVPNSNSETSDASSNVIFENFNVTDETVTFPVTDINAGDKKTSEEEKDFKGRK